MAEYDSNLLPNLQENLSKITLDNITSISLNTDALKDNFEAIVNILRGLVKRADAGQHNADKTNGAIKDLTDRLERLEDKQVNDKKELNEKIHNNENQIKETQNQTDKNTKDIERLEDALRELKNNQNDLQKAYDNSTCNRF